MRNWIWISLLAILGLSAGAALLAPTWAESEARDLAAARGFTLTIKELSLGFFSAEMNDVELKLEGVTGVKIQLKKLKVGLSLSSPRIRRIEVNKGKIELDGPIETIREQLEDWKSRRPQRKRSKKSSDSQRTEIVHNIDLDWKGAWNKDDVQTIRGLNVERGPNGQRFGIDLIQLDMGPLRGEVAGAQIELADGGLDLSKAVKVGASEVRLTYRAPAAPQKSGVNPAIKTLSAKKTKPAPVKTPALDDRMLRDLARVDMLKKILDVLHEKVLPRLPPRAEVKRVWFTYLKGKERLHLGPSRLSAEQIDSSYKFTLVPQGEAEGTPLSASIELPMKEAPHAATLTLEGGPIALSTLGVQERAFGLENVSHTFLSGKGSLTLASDANTIEGSGEASIEGLALYSARLSENTVLFPRVHIQGQGKLAIDGSLYTIEDIGITLGETRFEAGLELIRGPDYVSLKARAKAPLVSCQALLDSAPRGLLGAVERLRFKGTFSLDAGVDADTRHLSKMSVTWNFKNGCLATASPPGLDPERFREVFRREVVGAGGYPMQVEFGPRSASWTPYRDVSPYMEKALLVTEDGRFFRHDGFDDRAIESAIRANVRAGRFARGASTISMQLAKNLYLSRSKTIARKLQEVALTSILEQTFQKKELLELYVNVIEFGPGIYGIRQAAEHYFNTTPKRLSPAQAFFLASILPLPTAEYFEHNGQLSTSRRDYVNQLLAISEKRGSLSPSELEAAQVEVLVFGQSYSANDTLFDSTDEWDSNERLQKENQHSLAPPPPQNLTPPQNATSP